MTYQLGVRTLGLLAVVAVSTAALVVPELFGGQADATGPALRAILLLGHA